MRTDGEFFNDLPAEILATQERRYQLTRAKLLLAVSVLGIGTATIEWAATAPLIYLTPLVLFVFDLHILGEDYAVKRAGLFLRTAPSGSAAERIWEGTVSKYRDHFSTIAHPACDGVVLLASFLSLRSMRDLSAFDRGWVFVSASGLVLLWVFGLLRVWFMTGMENHVQEQFGTISTPEGGEAHPATITSALSPSAAPSGTSRRRRHR